MPLLQHRDLYGNLFVPKEHHEFVNFEEIVSSLNKELKEMSLEFSNLKSIKYDLEIQTQSLQK